MKQVAFTNYGGPEVLEIKSVDIPVPKANEVLIQIVSTTVTTTESTFRKGQPYITRLFTGLTKPKLKSLGEELAGEIIAIGSAVSTFTVGDHVFGTAGPEFGANAEYICIPEDGVICTKPTNVTFTEAASSVDGFLTSLPFLRDHGQIKEGDKILINGASGSVGSAGVQIAKYYGAEVTAVCSTQNMGWVKSIGADHVIDYTKEDFTTKHNYYDIIFDTVGKTTFSKCKKMLVGKGIFLQAAIDFNIFKWVIWTSLFGNKKAKIAATGLRAPVDRLEDLKLLKTLMEQGIIQPVVDRSYTLNEITSAHDYVDQGRKKGNVAIIVNKHLSMTQKAV